MKIAIIGIGRLGSVFAKALSRSKKHELTLVDPTSPETEAFARSIGAKTVDSASKLASGGLDFVIIAVKPARVLEVAAKLPLDVPIISCAAGTKISKIQTQGPKKIIRIMPNICIAVDEAVIGYAVSEEAASYEKDFLSVFSPVGLCIKLDEKGLEPITAASGSGPAFVAHVAKAMIEHSVADGLSHEVATKAVSQTLVGVGKMLQAGWSTDQIMTTVASPGGATAEGLRHLSDKKVDQLIKEAMGFTNAKARDLGK